MLSKMLFILCKHTLSGTVKGLKMSRVICVNLTGNCMLMSVPERKSLILNKDMEHVISLSMLFVSAFECMTCGDTTCTE